MTGFSLVACPRQLVISNDTGGRSRPYLRTKQLGQPGFAPSVGRAHVDPHADAVAGLVRQLGHLPAAVVHIGDTVAVDALFPMIGVARVATLHGVLTRRRVARATLSLLRADSRADHGAGGGGGIAAASAADLVTDDAADHGADQGTAGRGARTVTIVESGLVPAFAFG